MTWTLEKLEQIPEVYRDFMMTLKPVVDSHEPDVILKTGGVHFGTVYEKLSTWHDYEIDEVRQVAQALRGRGLIHEDKLGFFTPTAEGEQLIHALSKARNLVRQRVPPLPEF